MDDLSLPRPKQRSFRLPRIDYGPHLILASLPWLLLATVMRRYGLLLGPDRGLMIIFLSELALFFAFLIASQNQIRSLGGTTTLGQLQFPDQIRLCWAVIWRLYLLFVATIWLAYSLGVDTTRVGGAIFGFNGIVYPWRAQWFPVWNGFIAALVFLMVVERGLDRKPRAWSVLRQLVQRWRHLVPAILMIGLFLWLME